jgi:hypothetical protein
MDVTLAMGVIWKKNWSKTVRFVESALAALKLPLLNKNLCTIRSGR